MTRYILKRILIMVPTLLLVAIVIFLVVNSMPGDPALTVLGAEMEGDYEMVRARMGLNGTIWERIDERPVAQGDAWHHPDMFAKNKVYRYVPFDRYSAKGNIGQAHLASEEEGQILACRITEELAKLMDFEFGLLP